MRSRLLPSLNLFILALLLSTLLPFGKAWAAAEASSTKTIQANQNVNGATDPEGWTRTGIYLKPWQPFTVQTSGKASYRAITEEFKRTETDPDGNIYYYYDGDDQPPTKMARHFDHNAVLPGPDASVGALIGVFYKDGVMTSPPFFVGSNLQQKELGYEGELLLAYNDVPGQYDDNWGSYTATITGGTLVPGGGGTPGDPSGIMDATISDGNTIHITFSSPLQKNVAPGDFTVVEQSTGDRINITMVITSADKTTVTLRVQTLTAGKTYVISFGGTSINVTNHLEDLKDLTVSKGTVTLTKDSIYRNVYILGGVLDLNGKTLTAKGNVIQTDGTLKVNHGTLDVQGDFLIQGEEGTLSYGRLEMVNGVNASDPDVIKVGKDFVMHSYYDHFGWLNGGILEIKGNFTQRQGSPRNFQTGEQFKVILSGTEQQTVHFDTPRSDWSRFNDLEISNTSAEGVMFETPVSVKNLHTTNVKLRAVSIMDWTLTKDETISGNLRLEATTLDLNGKTLTVTGNLIHTEGILKINHGTLNVKGDYLIQGDGGTLSYGRLEMINGASLPESDPDVIIVGKNFVMHSYYDHFGWLNGGILEIKGDFTQRQGSPRNFQTGEQFKVILSGTAQQTVHFDTPRSDWSRFYHLEITNTSGKDMIFQTPISVKNLQTHGVKLSALKIMDWTLTGDETINGDFILEETMVDLNGKTLNILGKLMHTGGILKVNHGTLNVKGDYLIQGEGETLSYGQLEMINGGSQSDSAPDVVKVGKNFVMHSYYDHFGWLNGGVLDIKGNFTQRQGSPRNFQTGEQFKVILSGTTQQTVHFDTPRSDWSRFYHLEITNTSGQDMIFATPISVKNLQTHGVKLTALKIMDWTLTGDETINGDFILEETTVDLNGKTLTIMGNLIHTGGILKVNHGTLDVKGNYLIQGDKETLSYGQLEMVNGLNDSDPDFVKVGKNFVMHSYYDHFGWLSGGILEVKGNFTQRAGSPRNFQTGDQFKVVLSGTEQQTVHFDSPRSDWSRFYVLEIANTSEAGVVFATDYVYVTLIDHRNPDSPSDLNGDGIVDLYDMLKRAKTVPEKIQDIIQYYGQEIK